MTPEQKIAELEQKLMQLSELFYNHTHKGYDFSPKLASSGGTPGGSDTQIQFNDSGVFGGDSHLTFDKNDGGNLVLTAPDSTVGTGGSITINAGATSADNHVGGAISINAGDTNGGGSDGGSLTLTSGSSTVGGNGNHINITAGNGVDAVGGNVSIAAGTDTGTGGGGSINITSGVGAGDAAGNISIAAGDGHSGGNLFVTAGDGLSGDDGGALEISAGNSLISADGSGIGPGSIDITAGYVFVSGGSHYVNGNGGAINIRPGGLSGATTGTVNGGSLNLYGGSGSGTGTTGGDISLTPGSGGTGYCGRVSINNPDLAIHSYRQVGQVSTTDNAFHSATDVIETLTNSAGLLHARIVGHRTGGSGGTANDMFACEMVRGFKNDAGTVTLKQSLTFLFYYQDVVNTDAQFLVNGTNIELQVKGDTNNNYRFQYELWYINT